MSHKVYNNHRGRPDWTTPCNCGCAGSDNHHRASWSRKLKDVEAVTPRRCPSTGLWVHAEAEARMPWGTVEVVELHRSSQTSPRGGLWMSTGRSAMEGERR